jgi:hypothetical protein
LYCPFFHGLALGSSAAAEPFVYVGPKMIPVPLNGPVVDKDLASWLRSNAVAILAFWNGDSDSA